MMATCQNSTMYVMVSLSAVRAFPTDCASLTDCATLLVYNMKLIGSSIIRIVKCIHVKRRSSGGGDPW